MASQPKKSSMFIAAPQQYAGFAVLYVFHKSKGHFQGFVLSDSLLLFSEHKPTISQITAANQYY